MNLLGLIARFLVALFLSVAFAFALFLSVTSLGRPLGPVEALVLLMLTAWLGWATFRRWNRSGSRTEAERHGSCGAST